MDITPGNSQNISAKKPAATQRHRFVSVKASHHRKTADGGNAPVFATLYRV